ncbi:MAG TPA: YlxR family protein [Kofleriaceae bacterium]|nr:YlxR family protein [Kofleriaceae bacterium]
MRTCTGCRAVAPQRELVRVVLDGARLSLDPKRRLPGRGAYVHPRGGCVTVPGLARGLRCSVSRQDVQRIVTQLGDLSLQDDISRNHDEDRDDLGKNAPGLAGAITVETPPRIKAKDDRSEDARV